MTISYKNKLIVSGDQKQFKDFIDRSLVEYEYFGPDKWRFTLDGVYPTPIELLEFRIIPEFEGDEIEGSEGYQIYYADLERRYGYDNSYDWRLENWGTDSECLDYDLYVSDDNLSVCYYTEINPNLNWVKYASKAYPGLLFELHFYEPQTKFSGKAKCKNGVLDYILL